MLMILISIVNARREGDKLDLHLEFSTIWSWKITVMIGRPGCGVMEEEIEPDLAAKFRDHPFSHSNVRSRIANFWTLPVTVIGKASTNRIYRGIL